MWEKFDATTLWEVLPVTDAYRTYTTSCSHSHPMQAGFDIYFYEDIAGIRPVPEAPGYKRILFAPGWKGTDLQSASATVQSRYGEILSSWERKDGKIAWKIVIPAGCDGVVSLPEGSSLVSGENDGNPLPPGSYSFIVSE